MNDGLTVALSGQIALNHRLETLAQNIANINTAGYRAEGVHFASLLAGNFNAKASYPTAGETFISTQPGSLNKTDNPLDVAVKGNVWFGISTSKGIGYTRDGRLQMTAAGELQTVTGHPILDAGGATMLIDPAGGEPVIASDGTITQNGKQVGALGLFELDPQAHLSRGEDISILSDKPANPVLDFSQAGVVQGFVEGANVDPVQEMTKLVMVQRDFEHVKNAVDQRESSMLDAIKSFGP